MRFTNIRGTAIGGNRPRISVDTEIAVSFSDVAGADEAKQELGEIVSFLKQPATAGRLGGLMPKALLLVGPPGTGKSLLARATAGEAQVPFLAIGGAELVEGCIAPGAVLTRDLFEQARRHAPAIVFIDDLDAVGRRRETGRLLIELDRLDRGSGVAVLAATSRLDIIDPALLRAGRFEMVPVPCPDKAERCEILRLHTRMVRMAEDLGLEKLAALTPGFSGAGLANLVNKAALLATRRGADAVAASDFSDALKRGVAGVEPKAQVADRHQREVLAYHETGHALLALLLPGGGPIQEVSIVPRSIGSSCCAMQRAIEQRVLLVRQELENEMTVLLAGRAAEQLVFGEVSTHGYLDLRRATAIALGIAARHGMTAELGQISYEEELRPVRSCSEDTAREIARVVKSLTDRNFGRAVELLKAQREILEQGARLLIDHGTLAAADLAALRERNWSQIEVNDGGTS